MKPAQYSPGGKSKKILEIGKAIFATIDFKHGIRQRECLKSVPNTYRPDYTKMRG